MYESPTQYLGVSAYRNAFFFIRATRALSDNAILFTSTPGNDYFVLVFMCLALAQTQLIHKLMVWPIYS